MKILNIKNKIIVATLLVATAALNQSAMAWTNSPGIDNKQHNQKDRIVQGINSGQLSAQEAWRLGKQQGRTYQKEQRFKADGNFTRRERAKINRDLKRSSKSIYRQKHNRPTWGVARSSIRSAAINKRQVKQRKRIGQGVRSGALTGREATKLRRQQARINKQERRFKADGRFTKRERARVHKSQNRASKNIYRKKHNGRKRH